MTKVIVTLLAGRPLQVDIPDEHNGNKVERSLYGAIRLFPNVPRTISADELAFVKEKEPNAKFREQKYVETKRLKGADGKKVAATTKDKMGNGRRRPKDK